MDRPLVLLVEDDDFVRAVIYDALVEYGFAVLEVPDGRAALSALNISPRFDALVTDVQLGYGPNGWAVARAVREVLPSCAVIYVTGFAPGPPDKVPDSVLLMKPFRPRELCSTLSSLLPPVLGADLQPDLGPGASLRQEPHT